jgi:hypothetical protein
MSKTTLHSKLEKIKSIRSRQVYCPVAKLRAIVSPLTVQDDLTLKTMVSSPDQYDLELSHLIYNKSQFPDVPGDKPSFEQFIEVVSDFDKKSLLWGIYEATYSTLGKHNITCPKCKNKFESTIMAKDLLHIDTFKQTWEKEVSFDKYTVGVTIETGLEEISKYVFNIGIPSIKKHLNVLKLITVDEMKDNFTKFNSIVSKVEEVTLITNSIEVHSIDETDVIDNIYDIHSTVQQYVTLDVINDIIDKFDEEFKAYNPSFKKDIKCNSCGNEFDFPIDIEVALFRSFLRL